MKFCPICREVHEQEILTGEKNNRPITFIKCLGCNEIHSLKFVDATPDARGVERQRVSAEMWAWLENHWSSIMAQFETPLNLHEGTGVLGSGAAKGKKYFGSKFSREFWKRLTAPAGVKEVSQLLIRLEKEYPDMAVFISLRAMGYNIRQIATSDQIKVNLVRPNGQITRTGQKMMRLIMAEILACLPDEIISWWQAEEIRAEGLEELAASKQAKEEYLKGETDRVGCPRCGGLKLDCDLCRDGTVPRWMAEVYQTHGENWHAEVVRRKKHRAAEKAE